MSITIEQDLKEYLDRFERKLERSNEKADKLAIDMVMVKTKGLISNALS